MATDTSNVSSFITNLTLQDLSKLDIVKLAYLLMLQRPIDPTGEASWIKRIELGEFSILSVIDTLQGSPEYRMVNAIPFSQMIHKARK